MRNKLGTIVVAAVMVTVACLRSEAGETPHDVPVVNPTPHEVVMLPDDGIVDISAGVRIMDKSGLFSDDIGFLPAGGRKSVRLTVDFGAKKAARAGVRTVSGAYLLAIGSKGISVLGYDERGAFYGLQTLRQIAAQAEDGHLPCMTVNDWPDLPARGVVEGFYGTPWSHEARLSLIEFYGRYKMNTYIYGPKDDPYHSSPDWRKPYPAEEAAQIKELVEACRTNYVDFVWAIHPGQDIKWNEEDYAALVAKFESMYALGVRAFAIFFDDISGDGANPYRQVELLNRLGEEFVKAKGDVAPLIICPTDYNRSWANPTERGSLAVYGRELDPSVRVFWTGDYVCSDLTPATLEWVGSRIQRPALYWWNFPVTDYCRHIVMQGPVYGLDRSLSSDDLCGFVSNPMEHAEASKLALYGVADYTWNMDSYDSGTSWTRALKDILPGQWEQLETIASHSSDLGPNGHAFRRDESVKITPLLERLEGAPAEPAEEDIMALRRECCAIETAADILLASEENPALTEELAPWLLQAKAVAEYGQSVCTMVCPLDGRPEDFMTAYMRARALQVRMYEIDAEYNDNPYQPGVKIAGLKLLPVINALFSSAVERYNITYGKSLSTMTGFNPDTMETTVEQLSRQPVRTRGKSVSVSPSNEVVTWHEGDHLTIVLKKECRLERITVDLGAVLQAGDFMVETMGLARDMQSFWSSIVYMNYVQFMLPHMRTENWDISERDYEAFCSVVQCYEPMVVIVWGTPVGNELKKRGQGNTLLPGADINYLFKQQISGKNYLFVNCYHPSNLYGVFMNDTDYFAKQLQIALDSVWNFKV